LTGKDRLPTPATTCVARDVRMAQAEARTPTFRGETTMHSKKHERSVTLSRRQWLQSIGFAVPGLAWIDTAPAPAIAQEQTGATARVEPLAPLNRFSRVVQDHFVERVRSIEEAGNKVRAALKTKADAEAYVADVRKKAQLCFGPFPEKTPLNPRVTGIVERDAYRIEKVIFESRPRFFVTANLYVPKGRTFPLPGVVGSCGHSENGKAVEAYQSFSQGLARLGYVVLIFDPIGQGERSQYVHQEARVRPRIGVGEHLHAGNQQFLVGEGFASWRAWDGIRALDYLLSRPEVDPRHVGITGNSGGGTMTTWLCAVEPRWTMAAPGCFVTTFRRNLENELPADTEQCPPRALGLVSITPTFWRAWPPGRSFSSPRNAITSTRAAPKRPTAGSRISIRCWGPERTSDCSSVRPSMGTRARTARRCTGGSTA
jgi:dienelactone hydrolase